MYYLLVIIKDKGVRSFDPRFSLSFAKLVMMSSAPAKSARDARYASQDPFIHRTLSHIISTPICIRSAFFLRRTQLARAIKTLVFCKVKLNNWRNNVCPQTVSSSCFTLKWFSKKAIFFVEIQLKLCLLPTERTGKQEVDFYFFSWIFSSFVSTCYTYIWDVKMDWGLLDPNHGFLRAKLLFKHLVRNSWDYLRLKWKLPNSTLRVLCHSAILYVCYKALSLCVKCLDETSMSLWCCLLCVQGGYDRQFPSCFELHYESEAKCTVFIMKISVHSYANKANFHMNCFTLSLAFTVRTRKWPIKVEPVDKV